MNYKHAVGTEGLKQGSWTEIEQYQKFRWLTDLRVDIDIKITREFGDKWASSKKYFWLSLKLPLIPPPTLHTWIVRQHIPRAIRKNPNYSTMCIIILL